MMKLLNPTACHPAVGRGNAKRMTVMGDAIVNWLSDRGSIPLSSTKGKCLETLCFGHFPFSVYAKKCVFGVFWDVSA